MRVRVRVSIASVALAIVLPGPPVAATSPIDDPTPSIAPAAATANPFLPDDTSVNLTDCISAQPRPDCGSDERGGWRQAAVFGAVVAGLAAVGVRLAVALRRR